MFETAHVAGRVSLQIARDGVPVSTAASFEYRAGLSWDSRAAVAHSALAAAHQHTHDETNWTVTVMSWLVARLQRLSRQLDVVGHDLTLSFDHLVKIHNSPQLEQLITNHKSIIH